MGVRAIRPSRSFVTGRVSIRALGASVPYESSYERDFLLLVDFDPGLLAVEAQPVRIPWVDDEGTQHSYTPDYRVALLRLPSRLSWLRAPILRRIREAYCEIKPKDILARDAGVLFPKFDRVRAYCWALDGHTFEIFTEEDINSPFLGNVTSLRHRRDDLEIPAAARFVVEHLAAHGPMPFGALLDAHPPDLDPRLVLQKQVDRLISLGRVHADLLQPLTLESVLDLPRNAERVAEHALGDLGKVESPPREAARQDLACGHGSAIQQP